MSEITGIIHQHGCPVFVQLAHMANWNMRKSPEYDTRGASPVCVYSEMDNHTFMPRELTIPEIKEIVQKFVNNAVGAREQVLTGAGQLIPPAAISSTHSYHRSGINGMTNMDAIAWKTERGSL